MMENECIARDGAENCMKVLQVVPSLNAGSGVARFVVAYQQHMDRSSVRFDYCIHKRMPVELVERVVGCGSRVYELPDLKMGNLFALEKELDSFYAKHASEYDIVHCHVPNAAFMHLRLAKKHGIEVRILHSHLDTSSDIFSHRLRNYPLVKIGKLFSNAGMACSGLAGDYLFKGTPYSIVRNAIDVRAFSSEEAERRKVKERLGLADNLVVGCVARFAEQKNHKFLLRVFRSVLDKTPHARLLLVGSGSLEQEVKQYAEDLGISKEVVFSGLVSDTRLHLAAMDVVVMPSLYEGLCIAAIEAQAAGIPCVFSNIFSDETFVTDFAYKVALEEAPSVWADVVVMAAAEGSHPDGLLQVRQAGYDVKREAAVLLELYRELLNGK